MQTSVSLMIYRAQNERCNYNSFVFRENMSEIHTMTGTNKENCWRSLFDHSPRQTFREHIFSPINNGIVYWYKRASM